MSGDIVIYRTLPRDREPDMNWHSLYQVHRTLRCAERKTRIGSCVVRSVVDPGMIPPWRLCSHCFADYRDYSYGLLFEARPHGSGPSYGHDPVYEMVGHAWTLEWDPDSIERVECGVAERSLEAVGA